MVISTPRSERQALPAPVVASLVLPRDAAAELAPEALAKEMAPGRALDVDALFEDFLASVAATQAMEGSGDAQGGAAGAQWPTRVRSASCITACSVPGARRTTCRTSRRARLRAAPLFRVRDGAFGGRRRTWRHRHPRRRQRVRRAVGQGGCRREPLLFSTRIPRRQGRQRDDRRRTGVDANEDETLVSASGPGRSWPLTRPTGCIREPSEQRRLHPMP